MRRVTTLGIQLLLLSASFFSLTAFGHTIEGGDASFVEAIDGPAIGPFIYLGAKHMVTGYDHLLFLFGVIFFLYRLKDVGIYVTLFAIGHSTTLLFGVLTGITANAYLIDAIIGLSVVYKALDNLGAFQRWFGFQPSTKAATLIFGFFHGFGLATKIIEFEIAEHGLIPNLLATSVGVEIGRLLALGAILIVMGFWRRTQSFMRHAFAANTLLMTAGFMLVGYQLVGFAVA